MVRKKIAIFAVFGVAYIVLACIVVGLLLYNSNSAIIVSALASVALVFVTLGLVIATYAYTEAQVKNVKATNRQVAALTEAVVFFGVEEVAMTDQFFIQNVGPGIAYDINFKVIADFKEAVLFDNKRLSDLAFIKNIINALAPGQKIPFAVIDPAKHKDLIKETIEIEVIYKKKLGAKEPFKQRFPFHFAYQEQIRQVRETIPDQLFKIAKGIEALKEK